MFTVLIADDEAIIREGLKCIIDWEDLGFHIIGETANGTETLSFLLEKNPDLVMLDIRMPQMLGLEVIKIAREKGFTGKVIILSGYSDFKYAQEAIRYGIENYLTKPIDEDELEETLLQMKEELNLETKKAESFTTYRERAMDSILYEILLGTQNMNQISPSEISMEADLYQVVIYEKYSHNAMDITYRFSDLLMVTNENNRSYHSLTIDFNEVLLLKGSFCIKKFNEFVDRYQQEKRPQKGSPLDSLFITYGHPVSELSKVQIGRASCRERV